MVEERRDVDVSGLFLAVLSLASDVSLHLLFEIDRISFGTNDFARLIDPP